LAPLSFGVQAFAGGNEKLDILVRYAENMRLYLVRYYKKHKMAYSCNLSFGQMASETRTTSTISETSCTLTI